MTFPNARALFYRYLLGELTNEENNEVEERALDDDACNRQLRETEARLIGAYVCGDLTGDKRKRFEKYFLVTEERVEKLRLAESLYTHPKTSPTESSKANYPSFIEAVRAYYKHIERVEDRKSANAKWFGWLRQWAAKPVSLSVGYQYISRPLWQALTAVSVIFLVTLVCGLFFYQSPRARGLNMLYAYYAQERPVAPRLTGFGYGKYRVIQNEGVVKLYHDERDEAFRLIIRGANEEKSAADYHALGNAYLVYRDFDEAVSCFDLALRRNAGDPKLHNDLAVALMEREQAKKAGQCTGEDRALALEHLHRAIELAPSLLAAHFNLALCHEQQGLWSVSAEDWKGYLEKDSSSLWAGEARKHQSQVAEKIKQAGVNQEEFYQDFLEAYRKQDREEAWGVYKQSRLATGSFITNRLIDNYLSLALSGKSAEAENNLSALLFIGEIEADRVNDRFTYDLSTFYKGASPRQLRKISAARALAATASVRLGESRLDEAINGYRRAVDLFEEAGDACESLMARRRLGHCYFRQASPALSSPLLMQGRQECENRNYRWLLGMFLNELTNIYTYLTEYSTALDCGLNQVNNARQIDDDHSVLRGINRVAEIYVLLGRRDEILRVVQEGLSVASSINADAGQLIGLYLFASKSYMASGQFVAALDYEREAFKLSLQINNPWLVSRHYVHLGLVYSKLNNHSEAVRLMRQTGEMGEQLPDKKMGAEITAFSHMHLGEVYREIGDLDSSVKSYGDALRLCSEHGVDNQWLGFEIKRGILLTNIKRGDAAAAEEGLKEVTELYEKFRRNIEDENSRNSFFDEQQGVYDIAIDYAFTRQDPRRAFDFAETSRARSLLDAVKLPERKLLEGSLPEVRLPISVKPLGLDQIQARIPDRTYLLQYAALDDKLIIWAISKTDLKSQVVSVGQGQLSAKVTAYLESLEAEWKGLKSDSRPKATELYEILVAPVENQLNRDFEICVVPDKILHRLPFAALISPATGKYLIEEHTLYVSPSANMFLVATDKAKQKESVRDERLLTVGNPSFDGTAFPKLKDIYWATSQAEKIADFYPSSRALLEKNAREIDIRKEIEKSDVAHFATHYIADKRTPLLSLLPLAGERNSPSKENDGMLQMYEFYGLNLSRLRLIVLSACQTGIEQYYGGEGAIGLARPFQAAGIPLVIASLWPVESYPSRQLMIDFHRHRKSGGLSTAEALRQAQKDMLTSGSPELRNPYNWAAYTVIGGHAAF